MFARADTLEVSHKAAFRIAVPMALGYLTTPLVGIADTAIVGQLGDAAFIGGVAVATIFIGILLTTFNFLRFATSALTAQAIGRDDEVGVIGVLLRSCLMAILAGLLIVATSGIILEYGLWLMSPSAAVTSATSDYFLIRVLATPFTLLNFVFLAWLVGTNRPILSFALQTGLNITNIAVSYILVLELGWGVEGAAWGTVFAEAVTALVTVLIVIKPVFAYKGRILSMMFDGSSLKRMMILNSDIMVRSFCLHAAFAFFTRQSAQQSDTILAANEILLHFFMIAGYFLDGFAVAVEQFVGRARGAMKGDMFKKALQVTSFWNLAQASLLSLIFYFAGSAMVAFMTPNEAIREAANTYLWWTILTPLIGVAAFQMDGVFLGATWSKDMRNMMLLSLVLFIAAYFIFFPLMQNHGLWLAFWIFLSIRGLTLFALLGMRAKQTFADY